MINILKQQFFTHHPLSFRIVWRYKQRRKPRIDHLRTSLYTCHDVLYVTSISHVRVRGNELSEGCCQSMCNFFAPKKIYYILLHLTSLAHMINEKWVKIKSWYVIICFPFRVWVCVKREKGFCFISIYRHLNSKWEFQFDRAM